MFGRRILSKNKQTGPDEILAQPSFYLKGSSSGRV